MDTKDKIIDVLKNHNLLCLATIDENSMPKARSVDYAMDKDESVLYFVTNKCTDKVKEIEKNNNVYVVIDHDCSSMEELQNLRYIRATAKAYICDTPTEIQKIFGILLQKFPYLKDLPGDPSNFIGIRVELEKVTLIDNTVHFGYTERITYR